MFPVDQVVALTWAFGGAVFGLIFGSAINAMAWRYKKGRSWVTGRSECTVCGHVLEPRDLIPVVSYLSLGGKCRYCHKPIKDPPAIELISAGAFAVSAYMLVPETTAEWVRLGFWVVMLVMLLLLALIDARWKLLPYKLTWPLIGIAFVYAASMAWLTQSPQVLVGALIAGVVAALFFFLLVVGTKGRGMGDGDIYLAGAMGLMLGMQSTAVAILFAFNVGAAVGLAMIAAKRGGRKTQIPFGPYLVAGTVLAFLYGRQIADWYLSLSGLY